MSRRRPGRHQPHAAPPVGRFPTADEIAGRAHELFIAGGRRLTKVVEYWRHAEQELLDIAARRALSGAGQPRATRAARRPASTDSES